MDWKRKKKIIRNSSTKKKTLIAEEKLHFRGAKKSAIDSLDGKTKRQRRANVVGKERKVNEVEIRDRKIKRNPRKWIQTKTKQGFVS